MYFERTSISGRRSEGPGPFDDDDDDRPRCRERGPAGNKGTMAAAGEDVADDY